MDIFGAFVIGGVFMSSYFNLSHTITNHNWETTLDLIAQENCVSTGGILEHDIYKIGLNDTISSPCITYADSVKITFRTDINSDGKMDSLSYYTGATSVLSSTPNPRDKPLYRYSSVTNKTTMMNVGCTNFKLTYYDTTGTLTTDRKKIQAVLVVLDVESLNANSNGGYAGVHWEQYIVPKHLHY
jgi:hypothetical protein